MNTESRIDEKTEAENLVHEYRIMLMETGTDLGEEILCTLLSIQCAKITCEKIIEQIKKTHDMGKLKEEHYKKVINQLDKM